MQISTQDGDLVLRGSAGKKRQRTKERKVLLTRLVNYDEPVTLEENYLRSRRERLRLQSKATPKVNVCQAATKFRSHLDRVSDWLPRTEYEHNGLYHCARHECLKGIKALASSWLGTLRAMSGSKLDHIVKGAPQPGTSVPNVVSRSPSPAPHPDNAEPADSRSSASSPSGDPLATLPSSPPQIYLNLLILEASLRSQYLTLRARRRQNTFFIFLLTIWVTWFAYLLFLRPREDGSGVGGSVYWVVEMGEKVALMGGIVTGVLIWGTGQWERGVRWPRRWVGIANRGLRNMNAKIVVIKGPWWEEALSHLAFLFPYSSFFPAQGSAYRYVEHDSETRGSGSHRRGMENEDDSLSRDEDLSPGGDHIKLLLLPKPFSPDFRENWELYRLEYWEQENERRAHLRQVIREREKELARGQGGWLWWTGWRGRKTQFEQAVRRDMRKHQYRQHNDKEGKGGSFSRTDSQSRNASRSSTPSVVEADDRPVTARTRRGSTTTSGSERRRKAKSSMSMDNSHMSKLSPVNRPA